MCCLSCRALKWTVLDCDGTKCPPTVQRHADWMIEGHECPQSVSVWVSIVSALWLTALLSTISSWSTGFSLQSPDRKKSDLETYKDSDLLYTLKFFVFLKKSLIRSFRKKHSGWQQWLPGPFGGIKMFWQPLTDKSGFIRGDLSLVMACLRRGGGMHGRKIGCDPCKLPSRLKRCSWN